MCAISGVDKREVQERETPGYRGTDEISGIDDLLRGATSGPEDSTYGGTDGGRGRELVQGVHVV